MKVDNRLAEAIQKGFKEKKAKEQKQYDEKKAAQEAREKEMKKFLPKARKWVNEHLFEEIAKQESAGSNTLILGEYMDGIPTEVIYGLVKKIKGLSIWMQNDITWQDSDFGTYRENRYYIQWKSADPNLNRNDR